MDDLTDLYQEIILNHNRRPRNEGELEPCTGKAEGYNPVCGDRITVYVREGNEGLAAVRFLGEGCAISRASASMMTDAVAGRPRKEAEARISEVVQMLTGAEEPLADLAEMGDLAALLGVRRFPARIKCATLAWHALASALKGEKGEVSGMR